MTDPAPWPTPADRRAKARQTGQIIVMFALFLTGMFGVLGLAIDLGYAFSQRRTMQNTADAAALAGARAVAKWSTSNKVAALPEVQAMTTNPNNRLGSSNPTIVSCTYVGYGSTTGGDDDDDDDGGGSGNCGSTVPSWAKGVRVVVEETHPTFFIRVVPGAPKSTTTRASATAHVQQLKKPPMGPFILCGTGAWAVGSASGPLNGLGRTENILIGDPPRINPDFIGYTFRVLDNKISTSNPAPMAENAACNLETSKWKGRAGQNGDDNVGRPIPGPFATDEGTDVGKINQAVAGAQGCTLYREKPYDCVMIIPIAKEETPARDSRELYVVGFAAFYVYGVSSSGGPCNNNCQNFNATLLGDFITVGPGENTWCRDCQGTVVIRLTD